VRFLNLLEYSALERPEQQWLWEGIIPKPGMTVFVGMPWEGKSFIALQIAFAMGQGRGELFGKKVVPGKVWYLQLDTSELLWRERLTIMASLGVDIGGDVVMLHPDDTHPLDICTGEGQAWVKACLADIKPSLTIIDVLLEIHNKDENSNSEMKQVNTALASCFPQQAYLLIHHTRKIPLDIEDPDPRIFGRGASALMGKADTAMILHNRKLRVTSRAGKAEFKLNQKENWTGLWELR